MFKVYLILAVFIPIAASAESITVVGDDNYPPYLFKDPSGKTVGYVADIWELWEKKTGVEVNLVSTSWINAQQQILNGQADVIEMMFQTADREPYYSFTEPFETVQANIYTAKELAGVNSVDSLHGFDSKINKSNHKFVYLGRDFYRDSDFLARVGGDEFVVVANHFSEKDDLKVLANRIIDAIGEPISLDNLEVKVSMGISIGIAVYPDDAKSQKLLISRADKAMYAAKKTGKNQSMFPV